MKWKLIWRRRIKQCWRYIYFFFKTPILYDISPRGLYYCYYCISRYINKEDIKAQEQYEEILQSKRKKLEEIKFFEKMAIFDEKTKMTATSFIHIGSILCFMKRRNRKEVFKYIKNKDDLDFLKGIIRQKVII